MQAFKKYKDMGPDFWAFIKFVSEMLGYTLRKTGMVKVYSADEIATLCRDTKTSVNDDLIRCVVEYSQLRADVLNKVVKTNLMEAAEASEEFSKLQSIYSSEHFCCKIPYNKQSGDMKQVAYFTAIISILAEKTIRESGKYPKSIGFDDSPGGLAYLWNENRELIGASSRRFDGAYPNIFNPKVVWEIKEYYYATTFGSRVADGVYETQLDGYEFKEIYDRTGHKVLHILFIDAFGTWWIKGKSYLCRIIDILNSGLVDEVIVGREALTRWPELLNQIICS